MAYDVAKLGSRAIAVRCLNGMGACCFSVTHDARITRVWAYCELLVSKPENDAGHTEPM